MTVDIKGLGKITASKKVLNTLAGYLFDSADCDTMRAEECAKENDTDMELCYKSVSRQTTEKAMAIIDALEEVGYYNK